MKLNHINLVVKDVPQAITFFETYFGFKCSEVKGDHIIAILDGTDNFCLVVMASKNAEANYPEAFHLGFMQDNEEQVNAVFQKLKSGGMQLEHEPRKIRNGFGFYFRFENIMIEVGLSGE